MRERRYAFLLWAAALLWIGGIAFGYRAMWNFQRKAGESATAPARWPDGSRLVRSSEGATVVVFAHPRCPCTRASISELRGVLGSRFGSGVKTYVLLLKPHELPDGWEKTDVWRTASAIPGVTVLSDVDGREAARLGALTSGQTVVYDAKGKLIFSGGITALRGETGDNLGVRSLASVASGEAPDRATTPVFGCPIREPKQSDAPGAVSSKGL